MQVPGERLTTGRARGSFLLPQRLLSTSFLVSYNLVEDSFNVTISFADEKEDQRSRDGLFEDTM